MIKQISAAERHEARTGEWLRSNYLFSFADYYDPANVQFGPLRVFNEDYVSPDSGFPTHPHTEMEIVTIVLDGEITHTDSLGNDLVIHAGEVQRMTAGTGITHSEANKSEAEVHLLQLWFLPNKRGIAPSYEQMKIDFLDTKDELVPLVTGQKVMEDVVFINSNSTIFYGNFSQGKDMLFQTFKIRKSLIYVLEGNLIVNGVELEKNDQVRLEEQEVITFHATSKASFILVDVPAVEANY
ncbi:pirin family protein [Pontibacter sp. BT310]|uniref:Pirin family protein n=1 Tax=Pontibacter populi TaxID=890055 RepID=A0ABS6XEZ0_9BACT|nr:MULTISPECIES: pirin-like bicupin family protein [Pontibacter]MBJ6119702.1 pirin family protein [Pontibacter sp. BT310]MBR0572131.1 pirin family protein [Microvirga sp. STS03]MBW3366555.1 pirin family protein [Pontibacter populi]